MDLGFALVFDPCNTCSKKDMCLMCELTFRRKGAVANSATTTSEWISVEDRLPTVEEEEQGLVGIVNGYNGKIRFTDAMIFVNYDFDEKEWWSQDYDLTDCKVEYWMPLPEAPKKGGGEE